MGSINKGILGGFSGKVGSVVGANWRGKDIMRSVPKPSSKEPTEKQVLQRAKFKLAVSFLQPVKSIQKEYFGVASGSKSRSDMAVSYTMQQAVDTASGSPELIFNKVLITKGDLAGFQNPEVEVQQDETLELSWSDNSSQGNASATDVANAVCYSEDLKSFEIYEVLALRSAMGASIVLPQFYAGKEIHLWMFFRNEKKTLACNSVYLGTVTLI